MTIWPAILLIALTVSACRKHPDNPATDTSTSTPSPTPPSVCNGGNTLYTQQGGPLEHNLNGHQNTDVTVTIASMHLSCGDIASVFLAKDDGTGQPILPWFPATTFTTTENTIHIHNGASVDQDWFISIIEK